jgi:hypothetical protein
MDYLRFAQPVVIALTPAGRKTELQTGDVLWVLLKTGQSSFYVMSSEPVATSSGHWSIDLSDVGSTDDPSGTTMYTFWIVSANPNGSQSILEAYQGPSEGEPKQPLSRNPSTVLS